MAHDIVGSGLEHFKEETGDIKEWGGAEHIVVFAHTHTIQVEIHAYGMDVQVFYGAEHELEQTVTRVLLSNATKLGNQYNHYDPFIPHVEVERAPIRSHA
eukprot:16446286-Heterocapsa_arctica.AAC.1